MAFNFTGKIKAGYLTAFVLLLFSYSLTFYTTWQLSNQNKILNHTNEVINNLELLHSDIKDITIGIRGYIIMRDSKFLGPYYSGRKNVDSVYRLLLNLTKDNELQQQRLAELKGLIQRKFEIADSSLDMFNSDERIVNSSIEDVTNISKKNSDTIRNVIGLMQNRENDLQKKSSQKVSSSSTTIKMVNLTSLVVAILLVIYSLITFTIENKAKKEADIRASGYRRQLEGRVIELNRLNKELEELKSMEKLAITGRIARAIAHEVRNPLTNIGLAGEQIKMQITEEAETNVLLEMIDRNVMRINQLITDLLNSSKFAELNYETISVNKLLDQSLELAMDRVLLKKIKVEKNYGRKIPDISIDVSKMEIAFLNIIVNAIEAMPVENGILTLRTEERNNKCVVTISDNGIGMDKETLSKLFEPYFTNKQKGNGLGMTNTQNIILNHKGTVEVKSEIGKGSSFIISLNFA